MSRKFENGARIFVGLMDGFIKTSFALTISFVRQIVPGKFNLKRNDEGLPPGGASYARMWSEQ